MDIDPFETQDNDPFQSLQVDPDKDYLSELVGEGKTYRDEKALARAVAEKEAFIKRLQMENKGMREQVNTSVTLQELMERLDAFKSNPPSPPQPGNDDQDDDQNTLTPDKIEQTLEQVLSKRERELRAKSNLDQALKTLQDKFGDRTPLVISETAQKLGVGQQYLKQLAQEQPKAFLALVGADTKQDDFFAPVPNKVDTARSSFNTGREKTYSYYEKLRKEDPRKYWTPEVQNEMFQQASRLGDNFNK